MSTSTSALTQAQQWARQVMHLMIHPCTCGQRGTIQWQERYNFLGDGMIVVCSCASCHKRVDYQWTEPIIKMGDKFKARMKIAAMMAEHMRIRHRVEEHEDDIRRRWAISRERLALAKVSQAGKKVEAMRL